MVTADTWYMLDLHKHYVRGHLAVAGGVTDQPGRYLEAMDLISEWKEHAKRGNS